MRRATRRVFGGVAAAVDHVVRLGALSRMGGQRQADALGHEARLELLSLLADRYPPGTAERYFREPRPIEPVQDRRVVLPDEARVIDLHWPSDYRTFLPEMQQEYDADPRNRSATARVVVHREPRPVAVLVHGYMGGVHRMERRIWPIRFLRRIGMDVALFVLPFHGPRSRPRRPGAPPVFPGADPRITNEGFRQAIDDLRDLVGWLLRRGHPSVGVMGMSLGGYTTALAATVEPKLSFAVPMIPLASVADMALSQGYLDADPRRAQQQHELLCKVYSVVSPLDRPALLPPRALLVIAGEHDRITPISHARKLAEHFRCPIETWPGGHLMQFGRGDKFRSVGRLLNDLGIIQKTESAA